MTMNKIATSIVTAAAILSTAGASAQDLNLNGLLGQVDTAVGNAYTAFMNNSGGAVTQAYEDTDLRNVHMNNMVNAYANSYTVTVTEGGITWTPGGGVSYEEPTVSGRVFDSDVALNVQEKDKFVKAVNDTFYGVGNTSLEQAFSGEEGDFGLAGHYQVDITEKATNVYNSVVKAIEDGDLQDFAAVQTEIDQIVADSGIEASITEVQGGVEGIASLNTVHASDLARDSFDNQAIESPAGTYCYWNSFVEMTADGGATTSATSSGAGYTCYNSAGDTI